MSNKDPINHWSMKSALEQISKCTFECEGGPLANNDAWVWLTGAAQVGPEFWPGQGVYFELEADVAGNKLREWRHFYIVGCRMDSSSDARFWTYSLSNDPPAPWHYGVTQFNGVEADKLRLSKP